MYSYHFCVYSFLLIFIVYYFFALFVEVRFCLIRLAKGSSGICRTIYPAYFDIFNDRRNIRTLMDIRSSDGKYSELSNIDELSDIIKSTIRVFGLVLWIKTGKCFGYSSLGKSDYLYCANRIFKKTDCFPGLAIYERSIRHISFSSNLINADTFIY